MYNYVYVFCVWVFCVFIIMECLKNAAPTVGRPLNSSYMENVARLNISKASKQIRLKAFKD